MPWYSSRNVVRASDSIRKNSPMVPNAACTTCSTPVITCTTADSANSPSKAAGIRAR